MSEPDFSNKEEAFEVLRKWHDEIRATLQKEFDARTAAAVAAAREEQREACARRIREEFLADLDADSACLNTPLTSTPLGDRLDELERDVYAWRLESAALRTQKEQAEAECDEWRRQLRDAERYSAEQEMAYADLTAELAMVRAAGKELTLEFEGIEDERDLARAQVEAARALCADFHRGGGLMWPHEVIAAMDGAKPK